MPLEMGNGTKYNHTKSELIIFEGFLIKENVRPLRHKYIFPAKLPTRNWVIQVI